MSGYGKARDESKTDPREVQSTQRHPELMCRVDGCPNRWSVHREGWKPMCSAHAWSDPHLWPQITVEQVQIVEQHRLYGAAREAARTSPSVPVPRSTPRPASTSRAYRELQGFDDVEHDREP